MMTEFWVVCSECGLVAQRKYRQNAEMAATEHETAHPRHKAHVEAQE